MTTTRTKVTPPHRRRPSKKPSNKVTEQNAALISISESFNSEDRLTPRRYLPTVIPNTEPAQLQAQVWTQLSFIVFAINSLL
jgi:hypothetical protein